MFFKKVKSTLTLFLFLFIVLTQAVLAKEPLMIYHAFDMKFKDVIPMVDELHKQGYDAIQTAPAQQSNPDTAWWARYQPKNYSIIEGRGSLEDLKNLVKKAKADNIIIISDVVFNHGMAKISKKEWQEADSKCSANKDCKDLNNLYAKLLSDMPQFKRNDFHDWKEITNWDELMNGNPNINRIVGWGNGEWADFKPESLNVQKVHKAYLDLLISSGIKGFRFDAEKHMSPDQYKFYVDYIRSKLPDAFIYGENLTTNRDMLNEYSSANTPVTDFKLLSSLISAFSFSGDLTGKLSVPDSVSNDSITFARNHDTVYGGLYHFGDLKDAELAWAYVLARKEGVPLVFSNNYHEEGAPSDAEFPTVKIGVKFRKLMNALKADTEKVYNITTSPSAYDGKNLLFMSRGNKGFIIINKAGEKRNYATAEITDTPLKGCYKEMQYNFYVDIQPMPKEPNKKFIKQWGNPNQKGFDIGPRTALFLYQTNPIACK
jgi:alpha-amylase